MGGINMTIEERAREEYPYITPSDGYECHAYNAAAKDGFIEGAKWMQSELIEKAVEWFKNQKEEIGISWYDDFEVRFRKAMEE